MLPYVELFRQHPLNLEYVVIAFNGGEAFRRPVAFLLPAKGLELLLQRSVHLRIHRLRRVHVEGRLQRFEVNLAVILRSRLFASEFLKGRKFTLRVNWPFQILLADVIRHGNYTCLAGLLHRLQGHLILALRLSLVPDYLPVRLALRHENNRLCKEYVLINVDAVIIFLFLLVRFFGLLHPSDR